MNGSTFACACVCMCVRARVCVSVRVRVRVDFNKEPWRLARTTHSHADPAVAMDCNHTAQSASTSSKDEAATNRSITEPSCSASTSAHTAGPDCTLRLQRSTRSERWGIALSEDQRSRDLTITAIRPGSPAHNAGMKVGKQSHLNCAVTCMQVHAGGSSDCISEWQSIGTHWRVSAEFKEYFIARAFPCAVSACRAGVSTCRSCPKLQVGASY